MVEDTLLLPQNKRMVLSSNTAAEASGMFSDNVSAFQGRNAETLMEEISTLF